MRIGRGAALVAAGVVAGAAACSSGPAQSSLGPFTIGSCKLGYIYEIDASEIPPGEGIYPSASAAMAAGHAYFLASGDQNSGDDIVPGDIDRVSDFTITLTATAVVQSFTVAYYNSSGKEIGTGTASLTGNGPDELTAGQTATFEDTSGSGNGASSCKVIGSDTGNA